MSVELPPNYVIVPAALTYSDLPASIQRTAERIYGLAWKAHRRGSPEQPLEVLVGLDDLMSICDLSRRQLFAHLRVLVKRGVLRYSYSKGVGIYAFTLPPRSQWTELGEKSADFRTDRTIDVVVDPSSKSFNIPHDEQQQQYSGIWGECEGGAGGCEEPHAALLAELGVLEPTRTELLELPHTSEAYLRDWLAWFQGQEGFGTGWVIQQIRAGIQAPEGREEREKRERQAYLAWGGS